MSQRPPKATIPILYSHGLNPEIRSRQTHSQQYGTCLSSGIAVRQPEKEDKPVVPLASYAKVEEVGTS